MKVYGNGMSNSSMKVVYLAELLGIDYEYQNMDFTKDLKTPEFLSVHPAGKIPAIVDNFPLWESNAILRYLASKESKYYSDDLQQKAIIDQWLDYSSIHLGAALGKVAFNRVFAPKFGMTVNEESITDGVSQLDSILPIINNRLGTAKYIAGDELTIADISLFATLEYAKPAQIDLSAYEHLYTWYTALESASWYTSGRAKVAQE